MVTAVVITVSDRSYRGERDDLSGPSVVNYLNDKGFLAKGPFLVPDELHAITDAIVRAVDEEGAGLVVTTGGTGLSPRDVTPEATLGVIDKHIPGFSEIMRSESLKRTAYASFSRGVCGVRGKSIVINLPGSPRGACENIEVLGELLKDAVREVQGGCGAMDDRGIN